MKSVELLEDFVREEISDCESFIEAIKEIKRYEEIRIEAKERLEKQFETYNSIDKRNTA